MGYFKAQLIGNLGRDPETRFTPNGKAVCEFSVAVNQSKPDGHGGWTDETDWVRVSVWGEQAKTAQEKYKKGSRVLVDGRFRSREYEDKDHNKRVSLEISADSVVGLDAAPRAASAPADDEPF